MEGLLTCGCGASYPVIASVPRFVPDAWDAHPEFAERHRDRIPAAARAEASRHRALYGRTARSFWMQWMQHRVAETE